VTAQQQSKEFVIATNLEAVNYGKNVGPTSSIGDGRDRGPSFSLVSGPRFLTEEQVAPTSGDRGDGGMRSGPALG